MGYTPGMAHEEARRIKLLSRLNVISFMVLLLYFVVEVTVGIYTFIPLLLLMKCFVFVDLFLLYKKAYLAAKHFSMIIIAACISFFTLFTGNTFSEATLIPLAAMPLIIFKNKKTAVFYLIVVLVLVVILKLNQASVTPLINLSKQEEVLFKILNILSAAIITYFITFYFKMANEEYESTLIKMNEEVSEKNREITDSIRYAKRIQDALITSEKTIEKSLNRLMNSKDKDK